MIFVEEGKNSIASPLVDLNPRYGWVFRKKKVEVKGMIWFLVIFQPGKTAIVLKK
jgi:hypothetical protein